MELFPIVTDYVFKRLTFETCHMKFSSKQSFCSSVIMKKVNKQCLLDTPPHSKGQ